MLPPDKNDKVIVTSKPVNKCFSDQIIEGPTLLQIVGDRALRWFDKDWLVFARSTRSLAFQATTRAPIMSPPPQHR